MTDKTNIIYIPHGGGPFPLIDEANNRNLNTYLRSIPQTLERPDAIIVISAHWEASVVSITAAANPPLLFDYYGFPPEAYEFEYPAPGHPKLAGRIAELLAKAGIESKLDDQRGLDHGVFVPMLLMYPQADIPCIQISLCDSLDAGLHVSIGEALSALSSENILILGSGFSFHNMPALIRGQTDDDPKNLAFEQWLAQTCCDGSLSEENRKQRLVNWEQAPSARYCHPREEHLLPLQVCYGIAGGPAVLDYQNATVNNIVSSAYRW